MSTRVLFFSPSAEIWEHSFPEALVAEMLRAEGMHATMVRCRGALRPLCPAAQAVGGGIDTPEQKQHELCLRCNAKGRLLDDKLGLEHIELDDFVAVGDEGRIQILLAEAEALRPQLRCAEDFEQLRIDGKQVGRTALYDLILRHKKNDFDFSDAAWAEYLVFLRMAATVTVTGERILAQLKPDRVSTYNSLYVPHRAFCLESRRQGIEQYFMHAGTNLARQHGTLMIGKDFTWKYLGDLASRYEAYRDRPASKEAIDDVTQHFLCLLSSRNIFVYSAARSDEYLDVRSRFGVTQEQKFIVASTSSYDERFAVESVAASTPSSALLFPRIIDWLRHLIELARDRPDWFILIRVHPREFPNRRDQIQSEHSRLIKDLLQELPANAAVNWPDDNLSLYDLAQEADLFLNAWSSVGKEMVLLGLPVVIYSPEIVLYPTSLNYVGTTKSQYLEAIEAALGKGWSFERCKMAYRWYALEFSRSCVDMRASYAPEHRHQHGLAKRILLKILRKVMPLRQEHRDLSHRKRMPDAQRIVARLFADALESTERAQAQERFDGSIDEEEKAIRRGLASLTGFLFSANPSDRPSRLQKNFIAAKIAPLER